MRSAVTLAPVQSPDSRRLAPGIVPRSRLVRALVASRAAPIATLVAPPGYGKSTLLAEWALRDERPIRQPNGIDEALRLLETAGARGVPPVIVVDDAHLVPPLSLRRLVKLGGELPHGAMLVLAARRGLPVPTGRLRAHRLVLEITARELAMSRMEAAMLLDAAGVHLDAAQVDLLVERTEGWPAALYLAALSVAEQADAGEAVAAFTGGDRLVADFLECELLAGLSDDQRAFLRRTSVLDRLSGPLCDAVLDTHGSTAQLEAAGQAGIPLEPLDRCDLVFRHHALLASMLRAELARVEPGLEPELHRRAADWHARSGDAGRAVRHALASHDGDRAGRLLWSLAPRYAAEGRGAILARWLEPFTDSDLAAHPPLALTAAAYHLVEGRRDRAERMLAMVPAADDVAQAVAMLRACIAREGVAQMGRDAARASALAPQHTPWQALGLLLTGVARHLTGDRAAARALLEDGAVRAAGHIPAVDALCHAQLALLAVEGSDWDDASCHARASRATVEPVVVPSAVRALVLAVHAVVTAHRGEIVQARRDAADAHRLLAALGDVSPWLVAEAYVWLARAEIRLSDGPTARALLARAARVQAHAADASVLAQWVHDGWERADAFAASATPTLTNAELRVLRLLPSHLSFREIGERLHVSTNTVKTQALSVYRKLDVSCRSEAVSRGRAAGLIGV